MEKDASITDLLGWLEERLGREIATVDFWEADLHAVGFCNPDRAGLLVYVSTFKQPEGKCYVEIEEIGVTGRSAPRHTAPTRESADREELLRILQSVLSS